MVYTNYFMVTLGMLYSRQKKTLSLLILSHPGSRQLLTEYILFNRLVLNFKLRP